MSLLPNHQAARAVRLAAGGLLVLAVGCGLDDYEKKMKETQDRVERFDEESRLLDEPIRIPKRKIPATKDKPESEEETVLLFFRPPKGIQPKFLEPPHQGLVYQYPQRPPSKDKKPVVLAPGQRPPPPAIPPETAGVESVYVGWAPLDEKDKNFIPNVIRAFPRTPDPKSPELKASQPDWVGSPKRPAMDIYRFEFKDASKHTLYEAAFVKGQKVQLAVVFQVNNNEEGAAASKRARELSLESIALDNLAPQAKTAYIKRNGTITLEPAADKDKDKGKASGK